MHFLLQAFLAISLASSARAPAPAAHCLDARAMRELHVLDAHQLLIRSGDSRHHVLLAGDCAIAADSTLLSPEGWVCGGPREFVRSGEHLCAVQEVRPLDAREYAKLAKAGKLADGVPVMPEVETRARRRARSGFSGSPEYCFRPSLVRSWSANPDGIVVHTQARRSGGYGQYQLEFANSCPEAATKTELSLRSGVGIDLICGNPGDLALIAASPTGPAGIAAAPATSAANRARRGCHIREVYPLED